jgi:hypothetical protein
MNHQTSIPKLLLWGAGAHGWVIHDLARARGAVAIRDIDSRWVVTGWVVTGVLAKPPREVTSA